MRSTARPALLLAVVTSVLLAVGCTTTVTGTATARGSAAGAPPSGPPPAGGAPGDAVAWVDQVCGALLPFIRAASAPPPFDGSSDPAALVEGISDYFGETGAAADTAISGMAAAGPSPAEGGDEVVTALTGTLTTIRTSFRDAQTRLDAIDTSDPRAFATELPGAIAPLQELTTLSDPTAGLESSPELDRAGKQAPNCQQIEALTG